jgi:hypothetical protein
MLRVVEKLFGHVEEVTDEAGHPSRFTVCGFKEGEKSLMPTKSTTQTFDVAAALMGAFSTNGRINEYLIENLPEEAWSSQAPGGKGRTIPAIIGHMQNVRLMWLKSAGDSAELLAKLDEVVSPRWMRSRLFPTNRSPPI